MLPCCPAACNRCVLLAAVRCLLVFAAAAVVSTKGASGMKVGTVYKTTQTFSYNSKTLDTTLDTSLLSHPLLFVLPEFVLVDDESLNTERDVSQDPAHTRSCTHSAI